MKSLSLPVITSDLLRDSVLIVPRGFKFPDVFQKVEPVKTSQEIDEMARRFYSFPARFDARLFGVPARLFYGSTRESRPNKTTKEKPNVSLQLATLAAAVIVLISIW